MVRPVIRDYCLLESGTLRVGITKFPEKFSFSVYKTSCRQEQKFLRNIQKLYGVTILICTAMNTFNLTYIMGSLLAENEPVYSVFLRCFLCVLVSLWFLSCFGAFILFFSSSLTDLFPSFLHVGLFHSLLFSSFIHYFCLPYFLLFSFISCPCFFIQVYSTLSYFLLSFLIFVSLFPSFLVDFLSLFLHLGLFHSLSLYSFITYLCSSCCLPFSLISCLYFCSNDSSTLSYFSFHFLSLSFFPATVSFLRPGFIFKPFLDSQKQTRHSVFPEQSHITVACALEILSPFARRQVRFSVAARYTVSKI